MVKQAPAQATGVDAKPGFAELARAAKLSYSGRFSNVEMFTQEMADGARRQVMVADAADAGFIVFVPAIGDGIDPTPLLELIPALLTARSGAKINDMEACDSCGLPIAQHADACSHCG